MNLLLGLLTLPVYALMLWPLVVGARRVLGVRIGLIRAGCAAGFGWLVAGGILTAFPQAMYAGNAFAGWSSRWRAALSLPR